MGFFTVITASLIIMMILYVHHLILLNFLLKTSLYSAAMFETWHVQQAWILGGALFTPAIVKAMAVRLLPVTHLALVHVSWDWVTV